MSLTPINRRPSPVAPSIRDAVADGEGVATPAGWLCKNPEDGLSEFEHPDIGDPWREPLTDADRDAGWTAVPLFHRTPTDATKWGPKFAHLAGEVAAFEATDATAVEEEREADLAAVERAIDRMGWPEICAFQERLSQDAYEDAGGFMLRKIKRLFGIRRDPLLTYQDAAHALVSAARTKES